MENIQNSEIRVHHTADVKSDEIGAGTIVWQFSVVLKGAVIGRDCNINCHCFIEDDVELGDRVTLKPGVYLWDGTVIESDVFIGPNVTFSNDKRPKSRVKPMVFEKTIIRKGASIGAGAVVVGPCEIGEGALIGAGAVVTKSVAPGALVVGNPAKLVKFIV